MAEKMQPLPIDAVIMQTSSASMAPLRMRVEGSALMPSWMDPTIAMAPMLTVSDAVTKASTNEESPALPVLYLSHSPKRPIWCSRLIHSPTSAPAASDTTIMAVPPLTSLPSAMESMPPRAPASPTKSTLKAVAFIRPSCKRGVMNLPKSMPAMPPATTKAVLISVPRPIMCGLLPSKWSAAAKRWCGARIHLMRW